MIHTTNLLSLILTLSISLSYCNILDDAPDLNDCYHDDSDDFCVQGIKKQIPQENLVFITPWNKYGYQNTLHFADKLDYISPVWFYLEKNKETSNYELSGK